MNPDFLIIGGGVIGLSIARELHKRGVREITVVDRGPIGREASWAAAGMLAPNIEADSDTDFHRFGRESLALYPALAAELLDETGIDIELDRTGTLYFAFDEREGEALVETFERQTQSGIRVELLHGNEIQVLEPLISVAAGPALLYPDDWQVENRKLVEALGRFAETHGIRVVEDCEVSELLTEGSTIIGAGTSDGDLFAGTTIIATGAWTSLIKFRGAMLPIEVKPIRGQMISFQGYPSMIRHVLHATDGYIVPRADGRILVGATVEDVGFDKGFTEQAMESLVLTGLEILPSLGPLQIADRWSGLRPFAADGLPVIGELPGYDGIVIATAHYRNGILLAPKTAEIIADKIVDGRVSPHLDVFGAERFLSSRGFVA